MDKKPLTEHTDDDLFSLVYNSQRIDRERLIQIIDELKTRGYTEKINEIENNLIKANPIYSGFWSRVGALLIDFLILGVFGFILGLFLSDFFVQLGEHGILIGLTISVLYFGLLNSKLGNGQTLGKMALNISVVDKESNKISTEKSILRALIYIAPYFLINYNMGLQEFSIPFYIKSILFLALFLVLIFHFVFNSRTRQGIHDLILDTYVINTNAYPLQQMVKSKTWPIFAGILCTVLIGLVSLKFFNHNENREIIAELRPIQNKIENLENISSASISHRTSSFRKLGSDENTKKTVYVRLDLRVADKIGILGMSKTSAESSKHVQDAVKILLSEYPKISELDNIQVNLIYGYNIGISKSNRAFGFSNSLSEWKQIVN